MKAKYLCTAVAALAATLMCATGAYAKTAEMVNGSVFVEAEDGNLKTYCKVGESEDASGGKFVTFGEKASKVIEVPRLATDKAIEYEYNIDRKSNVHIWVRIRAWDWKANQVSVMVNNETLTGTATKLGEFEWVKLNSTSRGTILNAGKQKLSIIPKTTGVEVDTVLITRKRATPTGINTVDDTLSLSFKDPRRFNLEDNGYSKETLADEMYWDVSDIKPVNERPRVNLRKADIPKILENAKHPENQSAWEMHLRYVEDTSAKPTTEMIEAKALDYQLRGNKEAGEAAVREAVDFYEKNGAAYQKISGDAYNDIGLAVRTLAEVYDWCYDLLDEDEKEYIIDEMIMLMSQGNNQELQWPLYTQNLFTTHQAEGLLQNDVMAMAIAIYDERPDVYNFIAGRLFNEAVEYRKWVFSSYTYNQGLNYLDYRLKHEGMATFFFIPTDLSIEEDYRVVHRYMLNNNGTYNYTAYNADEFGTAEIVVCRLDYKSDSYGFHIVEGVGTALDNDGDNRKMIECYSGSTLTQFVLADSCTFNPDTLKPGDIIQIWKNNAGEVALVKQLYSYSEGVYPEFATSVRYSNNLVAGTVKKTDRGGGKLVVEVEGEYMIFNLPASNAVVYDNGICTTIPTSEICTGDHVVLKTSEANISDATVIR